jgi:hypothetical protein
MPALLAPIPLLLARLDAWSLPELGGIPPAPIAFHAYSFFVGIFKHIPQKIELGSL